VSELTEEKWSLSSLHLQGFSRKFLRNVFRSYLTKILHSGRLKLTDDRKRFWDLDSANPYWISEVLKYFLSSVTTTDVVVKTRIHCIALTKQKSQRAPQPSGPTWPNCSLLTAKSTRSSVAWLSTFNHRDSLEKMKWLRALHQVKSLALGVVSCPHGKTTATTRTSKTTTTTNTTHF
jgi:hypothetical protein